MRPVILLDPAFRRHATIFSDADLARIAAAGDVRWGRDEAAPDAVITALADDVELIICGSWRHGSPERFPRLRAIIEVGGSAPPPQHLDYAACVARGVRVLSCAPAFGPAVAELGLGLAIASARQIGWTDQAFRGGVPNWSHTDFRTVIGEPFTLYGKSVGMIGFGGLARALTALLKPFGCVLQAYDPWLTTAALHAHDVAAVDLTTLLATSRVIFVLAIPSASNQALLDRALLEQIHPDAVLVLLSRAHLVDFAALTECLAAGRFRAAIDVFPEEPLPDDHPIRQLPNVVLSSHRAGAMGEALRTVGRFVADDVESLCAGLPPWRLQVVQPEIIRLRGDR